MSEVEEYLNNLIVKPSEDGINGVRMVTRAELRSMRKEAIDLVARMFKDETGTPITLTDDQADIFNLIFRRLYPRCHLETYTRFGKSLTVALALLLRASTYPEKWAVVAGNDKQAGIIMEYVIQHIFDNDYTSGRYQMEKGETMESIQRHRKKDHINFVVGKSGSKTLMGEIYITNAKGALGFGAPNVVLDEAALVPDDEEALVFRMLGDQKDNFYFKIGNPFESGHFTGSFKDPRYFKIVIDWRQGIKTGRITQDLVEEARKKPFFDVLYECRRPKIGVADDKGWIPILTRDEVDRAIVDEAEGFGINKIGADVAGGGKNSTVVVQRRDNVAMIRLKNQDPDTMNLAEWIMTKKEHEHWNPMGIAIDRVGEGKGCYDLLAKNLTGVNGVNAGDKPIGEADKESYINLRAVMFWRIRKWILGGGKLLRTDEPLELTWYQLCDIRYKKKLEGTKGKLQIIPKEQLKKIYGIESPDVADALSLTFATPDDPLSMQFDDGYSTPENFDKHGLFPTF